MGKQNTGMARKRAEIIMKVRCGMMTAADAARELGISRKTYYKWEQRGLAAMMDGLQEKASGRPETPEQKQRESELQKQIEALEWDNRELQQKMALKDLLREMEQGSKKK